LKVLVTGAGGFVGSHVARHLLASGSEVAALLRPGAHPRLAEIKDRLTVFEGDLARPESWAEAVTKWQPEACIHAAWYAEPGRYLDSTENLTGLRSGLDLLEIAAQAGCRKIVMAGTCFEYDTDPGYLREDGPTKPLTLYAAAKLALNVVARQRAAQLGVSLAWGRIFYVYGPWEDERRVVPALVLSMLRGEEFRATSGEQVRDYLHVADVASGLCALAERGCSGVFNVCSSEPVTMAQLMRTAAGIMGHPELLRLGARPPAQFDPPFIAGDNRRLKSEAGWGRRYDLESGLRETADWWRARAGASMPAK